jgi:hypothetical protein
MSDTDLENLASLAARLPAERRQQLEESLPFGNLRFSLGLVEGLHLAGSLAAAHSEPAASCIRETAAVAAAQLVANRKLHEKISRELDKPEVRAEIEEELRRFEAGQIEVVRMDDILRDLEEIEARGNRSQGGPVSDGTETLTPHSAPTRGS